MSSPRCSRSIPPARRGRRASDAVFFWGTRVRSALGFGEALIAVPPVALVLPADIAAPVAVLVLTVVDAGLFLSGASPFLHALLG